MQKFNILWLTIAKGNNVLPTTARVEFVLVGIGKDTIYDLNIEKKSLHVRLTKNDTLLIKIR